jgi:hypothetical protein
MAADMSGEQALASLLEEQLASEVRAFMDALEARLIRRIELSIARASDGLLPPPPVEETDVERVCDDSRQTLAVPGGRSGSGRARRRNACRSLPLRCFRTLLREAGWEEVWNGGAHPLKVHHPDRPGRLIPVPVHGGALGREQLGLLRSQVRRLGLEPPF